MRKKTYLLFIIVILAIYLSGCAAGPTATSITAAPDIDTNRLLIATYAKDSENPAIPELDSTLLDSLPTKLMAGLEVENIPFQATTVADLSSLPMESYPGIVIISYEENQEVKKVLGSKANQENILIFTTSVSPRLKINGEYVDAITSASKIYDPDFVSEALIERVNEILGEEM